jgi:hypothetical protein
MKTIKKSKGNPYRTGLHVSLMKRLNPSLLQEVRIEENVYNGRPKIEAANKCL